MHTLTPQLGKMQARQPTSEADQSCPVRKPAASELTQPEALGYCSGHNQDRLRASPKSGQGAVGKQLPPGSGRQERGSARRLGPGQERHGPPSGRTLLPTACVELGARGQGRKSPWRAGAANSPAVVGAPDLHRGGVGPGRGATGRARRQRSEGSVGPWLREETG